MKMYKKSLFKKIAVLLFFILLIEILLPIMMNVNIVPVNYAATTVKKEKTITAAALKRGTDDDAKKVTITGKYYKIVSANAFNGFKNLEEVVIDGMEEIGDKAFYGATNLKKVTIKNTNKMKIGSSAFANCSNLKTVYLGNTTEIGGCAFKNCKLLSSALEYNDTKKLTKIGREAFYNTNLENIMLSESKIERIEALTFAYCHNVTTIKLPNTLKSIGEKAFYKLNSWRLSGPIMEVKIPSSVVKIEKNAFTNAYSLKFLIPTSVTSIGQGALSAKNSTIVCANASYASTFLSKAGIRYTIDQPKIYNTKVEGGYIKFLATSDTAKINQYYLATKSNGGGKILNRVVVSNKSDGINGKIKYPSKGTYYLVVVDTVGKPSVSKAIIVK